MTERELPKNLPLPAVITVEQIRQRINEGHYDRPSVWDKVAVQLTKLFLK